jgi:transposase
MSVLRNASFLPARSIIKASIAPGTTVYTDEYDIDSRLPEWRYAHLTVNHGRGEYARDEDGDGFHEVHVNTMEGYWSLLRSWLRPHREIRRRNCRWTSPCSSSSTTRESKEKPYWKR